MTRDPKIPAERRQTIRERMREVLAEDELDARELSARLGISEKEVPDHLEHLERSLRAQGGRLVVAPAECASCGFVFRERTRLTRPGACPRCRGTRIDPPRFRIG